MHGLLARCVAALAVNAALALPAAAQSEWPAKPVRLLVPFAVGGGIDLMARITAQRLSEQFGSR